MQEYYKDKEVEGCTFKPDMVTHNKKQQAEKRALDKFIEDQYAYLEKVKKKAENARNQAVVDKEAIQNPVIDDYSKQLIEEKMGDRKNQNTYDRLFNLHPRGQKPGQQS